MVFDETFIYVVLIVLFVNKPDTESQILQCLRVPEPLSGMSRMGSGLSDSGSAPDAWFQLHEANKKQ